MSSLPYVRIPQVQQDGHGQVGKGDQSEDKNKHRAIMDSIDVSNFAELVPELALEVH